MDCAGADCGDHRSVNELKEGLEKGCKDLTVQAGAEGKEGTAQAGAGGKEGTAPETATGSMEGTVPFLRAEQHQGWYLS